MGTGLAIRSRTSRSTRSEGDPLSREFFEAVKQKDTDRVRALAGANPELLGAFDPDSYGGLALNIAVGRGDLDMIEVLLDLGADPDLKSDWWAGGFAALHTMPPDLMHDIAPLLVAAGATVDAHAAASLGDLAQLQECVSADPEVVHERGGDGRMPLHFAASASVVRFLVEHGAELEARDIDHESTPFMWAAPAYPEAARALVELGAQGDIFGFAAMGDADAVAKVLGEEPDAGMWRIDAERFPTKGKNITAIYAFTLGSLATPLHVAAHRDHPEVIRVLLENGVDPAVRGAYDESTALHIAAWEGSISAAQALIHSGAPLNIKSGPAHKNEPLGWAIVSGKVDMVKMLLAHGATPQLHHLQNAQTAAEGGSDVVSRSTLDDWRQIVGILDEAFSGA